eukprot:jgi/Botrbrau1/12513/Bobra.0169s0055.1
MASARPLQYDVNDEVLLSKLSEPGLKVVEFYTSWCGPCLSVIPTFKRLRLERNEETLLQFLTVRGEQCNLLPEAKEHAGHSRPLFLLYRNGVVKHSVQGANAPELEKQILALTPLRPEADDPKTIPCSPF